MGKLTSKTKYLYDNNNMTWYNGIFKKVTYTYNAFGQLSYMLVEKDNSGTLANFEQYFFTYDTNGNMTTKEYQSWMAGWMEYRKDIYSYNTSGQQIHDSVCYWDNIALIYKSAGQKFYTYDTHGNQIEILIQNWNFLDTTQTITSQIRYNYFYSCTTSTVSVEENQFQNTEVKVYPNPANTEIYFAVPNETNFDVEIYNTLGQMVLSEKNHSQTQAFNVSLLSKGLYQLKITTPKHSYFSKVVKN